MTIRNAAPAGIWRRAKQTLGKLWQGMINLPDRPEYRDGRSDPFDIPRFPPVLGAISRRTNQ